MTLTPEPERREILPCHWYDDGHGGRYMIPGCMERFDLPNSAAACGCKTVHQQLTAARRETTEAKEHRDSLQSWHDAIVRAVHDHPDGLKIMKQAADRATAPTPTVEEPPANLQVWPLRRVLTEVRCGSEDWTWEEEWADLDSRHATDGYLDNLERQIRADGITTPILIGSDGRLWDGHHRLRIAVRAGIPYVPVEVTP